MLAAKAIKTLTAIITFQSSDGMWTISPKRDKPANVKAKGGGEIPLTGNNVLALKGVGELIGLLQSAVMKITR